MSIGAYILTLASGHYYIGSSKEIRIRIRTHLYMLRTGRHPAPLLQSNYQEDEEPSVQVFEAADREGAYALEETLLRQHWGNPLLCNPTQFVRPGDWSRSEEGRRATSDLHTGREYTADMREARRQRRLGTTHSEETKQKMSETRKGRPKTPEWMANAHNAVKVKVEVDGEVYESYSAAALAFGVSLQLVRYRVSSHLPKWSGWKKL